MVVQAWKRVAKLSYIGFILSIGNCLIISLVAVHVGEVLLEMKYLEDGCLINQCLDLPLVLY
jgi:hypothetical protein